MVREQYLDRSRAPRTRPTGLPLLLYPFWWGLGFAFVFLPLVGLRELRRVGVGALRPEIVCFLVGSVVASLSALQILASPNRLLAAALRLAAYGAALGAYLFYRRASSEEGPGVLGRLRDQLEILIIVSCGLSLVGLVFPGRIYTAPISLLVPASLSTEEFIINIQRIRFTTPLNEFNDELGFASRRPTALFLHSNDWGAAITVMATIVYTDLRRIATKRSVVTLLAFGACTVLSLNRGAWLAIVVAAVVVMWTTKLGTGAVGTTMLGLVVVAVALVLSPVFSVIETRLDNGHSDDFRRDITTEAFAASLERPLLGYGAPIESETTTQTFARVGTHGQLQAYIVSHGMVAAALFSAFLIGVLGRGLQEGDTAVAATAAAIGVLGLFYEVTAAPMFFLMAIAGARAGETRFVEDRRVHRSPSGETGVPSPLRIS